MKIKKTFIISFLVLIFFHNIFIFAQDKTTSNYIIQQLYPSNYYPSYYFTDGFNIMSYGEYYIANKQDILNFIKKDTVDFSKLSMIIDIRTSPPFNTFISSWDSIEGGMSISNFHSRIREILNLQDSEIYKIGYGYYVLRKVKYAYIDTLKVYGTWLNVASYIYGDDIPLRDPVFHIYEDEVYRHNRSLSNIYISANDIMKVDHYQIFYYLIELLPTNKKIFKHLWKRKYELDITRRL